MSANKLFISILLLFVFISLACSMPLRLNKDSLSAGDIQRTLQAMEIVLTPDLSLTETVRTTSLPIETDQPTVDSGTIPIFSPTSTRQVGFGKLLYIAQSGDTLPALSARFGVTTTEILSETPLPVNGLIEPGLELIIPDVLTTTLPSTRILPDSEIIYSPTTIGFSIANYVSESGGFLSTYQEKIRDVEILSGVQIIQRVAELTSTNPRFLLAFLEFRSGWLTGAPRDPGNLSFPIGYAIPDQEGLYKELSIAANQLNAGYYGWRLGSLTELKFKDRKVGRISPGLNAGSVAVQRLFSQFYTYQNWQEALYGSQGFVQLYKTLFGDPWARAEQIEPLLPGSLVQPALELPFLPGERWALTGGPHYSWNAGSPRGALDFAPVYNQPIGCKMAPSWATASAGGVIVRTGEGILVLDLDGDGYEQTGWVLFYLHLAREGRLPVGSVVKLDDRLGHPSCEGGTPIGTHIHLARKYNGEWIGADYPVPFVLSGWQAVAGELNYKGYLFKGDQIVTANSVGKSISIIERP